jgi:hypothetical protein
MRTKKLIDDYQQKINLLDKEIERYTKIKRNIKEKHLGCPTKYQADFDYEQMVKDIAICNAQRQAYVQFIKDLETI